LNELGLKVKLDTNGTNPEQLSDLIDNNYINYIAMDIKAPLDTRYNKLTGTKIDIMKIKSSVEIIMDSNIDYEFRTTVVPKLLVENDILEMIDQLSGAKRYVLQQFVPDHARDSQLHEVQLFSNEELDRFCDIARQKIKYVKLRGGRTLN
jgi:pyruvate formate lyase activating enzyme